MTDLGNFTEDEVADWLGNNGTPPAISSVNTKLHTGDPGETGVANVAGETTRKVTTFDAASGGVISLTTTLSWTNVSTTETITWVSVWDNITAGNHLWNAVLAAGVSLTATDDFDLTALTLTIT